MAHDFDGRGHLGPVGIERARAGAAARDRCRPGPVRRRSGADLRALPAVRLFARAPVEPAPGVSPGGARPPHGREVQAAAEQYGYIVAASNNSRNGPHASLRRRPRRWAQTSAAGSPRSPARLSDRHVGRRARGDGDCARQNSIAGVVASSAGYPDSQPRDT